MTTLTDSSLATLHFIVSWQSDGANHEEHYYAADVNMWRDIFPDALRKKLMGCKTGDSVSHSFSAGEITGESTTQQHLSLPLRQWQPPLINGSTIPPLVGRYYPQGFLRDVSGIYPQTLTPMRMVSVNPDSFTVDRSHPLAGKKLEVEIRLEDVSHSRKERGGRCSDRLADMLENGPGMEGCIENSPIQFNREIAYQRHDTADDRIFYTQPRLISHIDSQASEHLKATINRLLAPGSKVLDLMASVDSHLPDNRGLKVIGLGMNNDEMAANRVLTDHIVQDLNNDPRIPFPDRTFDAVLCNLSIEYLTNPEEVIRQTARVAKPSGTLLISFSNRWFPPKVTRLWTELHEFERMGLVLQYCWPYYDDLLTLSFRNWPRPESDRHFPVMQISDPLYVVAGKLRP